jgi:Family of unknown function (DUF6069)
MTGPAHLSVPAQRAERKPILMAVGVAAVAGIAASLIIAIAARAAGVPGSFTPLSAFPVLVVIGVVAGAIGWDQVRQRSADPRRLLARLVPVVLLLSFIPDLAVGVTRALPHTTWGGVAALMLMHLAVTAGAVPAYRHFLPLRAA